jgi:hypothetical protein
MNEQELQAIRERLDKVTSGEWFVGGKKPDEEVMFVVAGDYAAEGEPDLVVEVWGSEDIEADADFIAHAPNDVKRLLGEVERLRGEMNRVLQESRYVAIPSDGDGDETDAEERELALINKVFDIQIIAKKALYGDAS